MKNLDKVKIKDNVVLEVFSKDGTLKEKVTAHNLLVNAGLAHIADQLAASPAQGAMTHMAVGTDNTSVDPTDTTLESEEARVSLTSRTAGGAVVTYVGTFGAGVGTGALTEAGIFNSGSSGTMLARVVFPVINKGVDDSLVVTWTVTGGTP